MHEEKWWVENYVRYTKLTGNASAEEVFDIDNRLVACLDASPHPIHFVIDVEHLKSTLSMDQSLKVRHLRHPKTGWIVLIGSRQNAMVRFMISVTFKIFGARYKDCPTIQEAAAFLKEVESTLPDFDI